MEACKITRVESKQELTQPGVFRVLEGVEDGMEKKLAKVVDGLAEKGGNGEVVSTFLLFFEREVRDVDAGEVEEGVFVVGRKLEFSLDLC